MPRNEHPECVGIQEMKAAHAREISHFRSWEAAGDWAELAADPAYLHDYRDGVQLIDAGEDLNYGSDDLTRAIARLVPRSGQDRSGSSGPRG